MADTLTYPPVTDELLREIVRRILAVGSPEKIVLFGSWARGDARPDSDLDVMIVEPGRTQRLASRYRDALFDLYPEYDVIVRTPYQVWEWSDVPGALETTALREGRVLYRAEGRSRAYMTMARKKSPVQLARLWLTRAKRDLVMCRAALEHEPATEEGACFHAQQAVEKSLKAVLAFHGQAIPKTHDLSKLVPLCRAADPALWLPRVAWKRLTKYAVDARYHLTYWPNRAVAERAELMAEKVYAAVLAALPAKAHPKDS